MSTPSSISRAWRIGPQRVIELDRAHLMGIVNATPDSFSDGTTERSVEVMIGRTLRLVEEGATLIDIGGASSRPGAEPVAAGQQIERTVPLIGELRTWSDVPISIDTTNAAVARAALDAGADVINDVSAGTDDEAMLPLAAERGCGVILMHRRCRPEEDSYSDRYAEPPLYEDDVAGAVLGFLVERAARARAIGVPRDAIAIDPGLGFGKSVEQNFRLIGSTNVLARSGYPVVGAASRKSFIGAVTGIEVPRDRVIGSTAVSVAQYLGGARIFRVHDVAAHREALGIAHAIGRQGVPESLSTSGTGGEGG